MDAQYGGDRLFYRCGPGKLTNTQTRKQIATPTAQGGKLETATAVI